MVFCTFFNTLDPNVSQKKNIESRVLNNGWSSSFFELQRGVSQGCPLSPYLFILSARILAKAIRFNDNIIFVNDTDIQISQYIEVVWPYISPSLLMGWPLSAEKNKTHKRPVLVSSANPTYKRFPHQNWYKMKTRTALFEVAPQKS